jgi:glutathione synthase
MRLAFWINDLAELEAKQTTAMLMGTAVRRDHEVFVVAVADLQLRGAGSVTARARRVGSEVDAAALRELRAQEPADLDHATLNGVLIRTNPGRAGAQGDWHDEVLGLAEILQGQGVVVLNDPGGLRRAKSKLFLAGLDTPHRPETLVARDEGALLAFLAEAARPCVAKPLIGTRGQGVFRLTREDPNARAILTMLCASGPVLVQHFAPGAEGGDLRLLVLEGEPLVHEGRVACVQRVPPAHEWRSNIHLGGQPEPGEPTPAQLSAAKDLGQRLLAEGIVFAGLDMIGDQAVELNVYSTGGLRDANRFSGLDFTHPVLAACEARISTRRA